MVRVRREGGAPIKDEFRGKATPTSRRSSQVSTTSRRPPLKSNDCGHLIDVSLRHHILRRSVAVDAKWQTMRAVDAFIATAVLGAAAVTLDGTPAAAICSVFDRHPCMPTV